MDIWHLNGMDWRGLVTDISAFKTILPVSETTAVPKVKKKGKAKNNDTEDGAVVETTKEAAGRSGEHLKGFFEATKWTHVRFKEEYKLNFALMEKSKVEREDRLSDRLGTCVGTMCGIPWNPLSHNRSRDWTLLALAVTVETALIEAYRTQLLLQSSGARALRTDLRTLFLAHTFLNHVPAPDGGVAGSVCEWEFADKISDTSLLTNEITGDSTHDFKNLMSRWEKASTAVTREKKDTIAAVVQYLEKNKLLQCSEGDNASGTIETLASEIITVLAEVECHHTSSFLFHFLTSLTDDV